VHYSFFKCKVLASWHYSNSSYHSYPIGFFHIISKQTKCRICIKSWGSSIHYLCTKTRKSSYDSYTSLLCCIIFLVLKIIVFVFSQLLSIGNSYAPDIEYQYTVMRDERDVYVWALTDEWGQCDKMCSGMDDMPVACNTTYCFILPTNVLFCYNRFCVIQVNKRRFTCASGKRLARKPEVIAANTTHPAPKSNRAISTVLSSTWLDF